jgi:DNA-binding protein YbaB
MSMALEDIIAEANRVVSKSKELEEPIAGLEGTAAAADGYVEVTVAAGGRVKSINLNPRAMKLGSEDLAEALMEAIAEAQELLDAQMQEATKDFLGDGSILGKLAHGEPIDPYNVSGAAGRGQSQLGVDRDHHRYRYRSLCRNGRRRG